MSFFVFLPKDLKEVGRLNLLFSCADGVRFWASFKEIVGNKQFDGTLSRHGLFDCSFVFLKIVGEDLYLVQRVFSCGGWGLERCGVVW
jgi:hypothetical protein